MSDFDRKKGLAILELKNALPSNNSCITFSQFLGRHNQQYYAEDAWNFVKKLKDYIENTSVSGVKTLTRKENSMTTV